MVIIIDIEQLMTLMVSCSANGSAPTANEPANTDKMIVGISNQRFAPLYYKKLLICLLVK